MSGTEEWFSIIRILKSKLWTFIAVSVTLVLLLVGVLFVLRFYVSMDIYATPATLLNGSYSVDGGEWKKTKSNVSIDERFHTLEMRGRIPEKLLFISDEINLSTKDVWFELSTIDGKQLCSYTFEEMKASYEHMREGHPYALKLPETPGYNVTTINTQFLTASGVTGETELVLTVIYPYSESSVCFEDCFQVTVGLESGMYLRFFFEAMPVVLLFMLVCFFGLFFFPIAGRVLGRMNLTYLAFGALCFFWGFYMIVQNLSGYFNLWIKDRVFGLLYKVQNAEGWIPCHCKCYRNHLSYPGVHHDDPAAYRSERSYSHIICYEYRDWNLTFDSCSSPSFGS